MAEKISLFELDVEYDDVLSANAALIKQINTLKKEQKELLKSTDNLTNGTEEQSTAYVANQQTLASLNKQYKSNDKVLAALNTTQVDSIETVEEARAALSATGVLWAKTTKLEGENSESSVKLAKRKLELTDRLKELESATGDNTRNVGNYSDSIDDAAEGTGGFGVALGGLKDGLGATGGAAGQATNSLSKLATGLKSLLANPVVLIVAGIVAAFTALYKVFADTDDGGTELEAQFAKLGAIMDVLKRRAVLLIDTFKNLFSGDFKAAAESFGGAVKGVSEEINNATQAAYDYVVALDVLKDAEIGAISEQATARNEIEKNITLSKDQTKSNQERVDALVKASEIEKQLAQQKIDFAEQAYQLELKDAARAANINAEVLANFIALGSAEQEFQRANNKELAAAWNVLGDERIEALEKAAAKGIEAETFYFKKSKETTSQLSGLQKKLAAEEEANNKAIEASNKARIEQQQKDEEANSAELIRRSAINLAIWEQENQSIIDGQEELTVGLVDVESERLTELNSLRIQDAQLRFEQGKISEEQLTLEKLKINDAYNQSILDLNNSLYEQQLLDLDAAILAEKETKDAELLRIEEAAVADAENKRAIAQENYFLDAQLRAEQLEQDRLREIEAAEKSGADVTLINQKYANAQKDIEQQTNQAKLALASDFLGNIATIFGKSSKAGKAAAAAAATVSAIQGAVGAFSSLSSIPVVGPALGAVAAAAALASGYANVKKIYAVKSGLPGDTGGGGGSTPSGGASFTSPRLSVANGGQNDGGTISRDANTSTTSQIKEGVSAALLETPQQPVLILDEVTAAQNEVTAVEVITEA